MTHNVPDALAALVVNMFNDYMLYGDDGGMIHPFEKLRRDNVTRLVTGTRAYAPDISDSAFWSFGLAK